MRNSQVELTPTWVSLCHAGAPAVMEPPGGVLITDKIVVDRVDGMVDIFDQGSGLRLFRKVRF